jgi:hypothetical protein
VTICICICPDISLAEQPDNIKKVTYTLSILSASEIKKSALKHVPKTQSLHLSTDEPWDTMKAQILTKITAAINPLPIDFLNFDITFYTPRVLLKPGLSLATNDDYAEMIQRAHNLTSKDPMVNLLVSEKGNKADKEAEEVEKAEKVKGKKNVHVAFILC